MAFDGAGTFSRIYSWVSDKNAGTKITASRIDAEDDAFATGLSNCICKDGQSTPTANIPMGGFKITGLGNASAGTDALNRTTGDARYFQLANGSITPVAKGSVTTGIATFDFSAGPVQSITNGGAHTWAFSNLPASDAWEMRIKVTNGSAFTITFPTISWATGTGSYVSSLSASGVTLLASGVNWVIFWGIGSATIYGRAI